MSNGECKFRINPEGKIECKHVSRQRFFRRENFPFHNRWNVIYRLGKASQRQLPNERREKRFFDNFQLVQFITINVRCSSTFFMLLPSETAPSSWKFQLNLYSHYPKKIVHEEKTCEDLSSHPTKTRETELEMTKQSMSFHALNRALDRLENVKIWTTH